MGWDGPNKDTGMNTKDDITTARDECTESCEKI